MFAVFRERASDAGLGDEQTKEFRGIRAQQPGFRGAVEVEADDGRVLTLILWDSAEQQQAATTALRAAVLRLGGTQPAGPTGKGQVIYNDLTKS